MDHNGIPHIVTLKWDPQLVKSHISYTMYQRPQPLETPHRLQGCLFQGNKLHPLPYTIIVAPIQKDRKRQFNSILQPT